MKVCSRCKNPKALSEFGKSTSAKDGRQSKCKSCSVEVMQAWKQNNPEKYAEYNRKKALKMRLAKHGIPESDWEGILSVHGSKCAICHTELTTVFIDHDHATSKVRGLLCGPCNSGLGFFKDNIGTMKSAIRYLQNPPLDTRGYYSENHLSAENLNGWKPNRLPRTSKTRKSLCECGNERSRQAKQCKDCAAASRAKAEWPDNLTLSIQVSQHGYTAVGRMYGVSDNAVRKRLRIIG